MITFISLSLIVLILFYLVFLLAKKLYNDPSLYSYKSTINNSGSDFQASLLEKNNIGKSETKTKTKNLTISQNDISKIINGKVKNLVCRGGKITINGIDIPIGIDQKIITINLEGDIESIQADNSDINITGNVSGAVQNYNGEIKCNIINGNADNKNGNIIANSITGSAITKNGNIIKK